MQNDSEGLTELISFISACARTTYSPSSRLRGRTKKEVTLNKSYYSSLEQGIWT